MTHQKQNKSTLAARLSQSSSVALRKANEIHSVFHVWEFHVSGAEGGCVFHRGPSKFDRGDLRLCRLIAAGGATASFAALFTSVASGAGSRSHCYQRWG
jgi:hypothetical protein